MSKVLVLYYSSNGHIECGCWGSAAGRRTRWRQAQWLPPFPDL